MKYIGKRQMQLLGHILKNESVEVLTFTGKIEGKQRRGRKYLTYLGNLSIWVAPQSPESKERWEDMYVCMYA